MGLFKKSLPILGLFILTIAFFAEAIFCGKTFFFWDAAHFFYPMKHFIVEVVKSGHLPLWNPYIHSGMPQIANLESGFFYPPSIIFYLLPFDLAYRYFVISHYFLAGLFMYLLLRHWSLSRYSAFFSGIVFMFSGYLVSMSNGINILSSAVWAPLILLFLDKAIRRRSPPFFLLTGIFISIQFLSGDPVNTYFTIIICVLYLLVHIVGLIRKKTLENPPIPPLLKGGSGGFKAWSRKESLKQSFTLLFFFLLAGVTALLLSACQLLPSIEFTRLSTRCLGLTYAHASYWPLEPQRLLTFFAPYLFGNTATSPFAYTLLFKLHAPFFFSIYLGILPLCLSSISILFVRKREVWFFGFLLALSLILALGKYTPIHYLFWRYIPLYNFFRFPVKAIYLVTISVSVLAGFGLEWLMKNRENGGLRLFSKIFFFSALFLFLMVLGLYIWPGQTILFFGRFLNLEFPREFLAGAYMIDSLFFSSAVILLTSGVIFFGITKKVKINFLKMSLTGLLITDLFFTNLSIVALESPDFYTKEPKSVSFLKGDKEFYRLYRSPLNLAGYSRNIEMSRNDYYKWDKEIVSPNMGTMFGLFYADGCEAAHLLRYSLVLSGIESAAPIERTRPLGLLNVKYIFSAESIQHPELKLVKEIRNNVKVNVKIYENLGFLPRVFLVGKAIKLRSSYEALKDVFDPGVDLAERVILDLSPEGRQEDIEMAKETLFERGTDVRFAPLNCDGNGLQHREIKKGKEKTVFSGSAKIIQYEVREIIIDTEMQDGGYLVLADTYYPGWKVWVDNQPAEILKANYIFRAVALEKGKHRVRFFYDPISIKLGIAISVITVIILGIYFLWRKRRGSKE